jgi:hypothetical protein
MTLHPIPLNFLIYEENFIFFFNSVERDGSVGARLVLLGPAVVAARVSPVVAAAAAAAAVCEAGARGADPLMSLFLDVRAGVLETKKNFGSKQNKLKQDLFQLCFGLFRETKNKYF